MGDLRSFPPLNAYNSLLHKKGPVFLTVHTLYTLFTKNDSSFSTSSKEYPSRLKHASPWALRYVGIGYYKVFIKCVFFCGEVGSGGYVLSFGLVQFLFEKAPPGGGFTTPQLRRFIFYSLFFILYFLFFIFYSLFFIVRPWFGWGLGFVYCTTGACHLPQEVNTSVFAHWALELSFTNPGF